MKKKAKGRNEETRRERMKRKKNREKRYKRKIPLKCHISYFLEKPKYFRGQRKERKNEIKFFISMTEAQSVAFVSTIGEVFGRVCGGLYATGSDIRLVGWFVGQMVARILPCVTTIRTFLCLQFSMFYQVAKV